MAVDAGGRAGDARAASGGATGTAGKEAGTGGRSGRDASVDASGAAGARLDAATGETDATDASAADAADVRAGARFEWQLFYDHAYAAHVEADINGDAVVSGTFFDAKDVALGSTTLKSHGGADILLNRVSSNGMPRWARSYGGTSDDYPVSFILDVQGRISLVGLYNGIGNVGGPDFPAFTGTPGRFNVYVAELTADGDHVWSTTAGTTADSFGGPVLAATEAGGVFVPGYFAGTATIGGVSHASAGGQDAFFGRIDTTSTASNVSGEFATAVTFGGPGDDRAVAVLHAGTGPDVDIVGQFQDTVIFPTRNAPTTLTSHGGTDVFVARATPDGALLDVVTFGGSGDDVVTSARLDASDGASIIIAGSFDSPSLSILGGAALVTEGGKDGFVAKLDPGLKHVWSERFGGAGDDLVRDVSVGVDGVVAVTGEFTRRIAFGKDVWNAALASDAGPGTSPGPDFFVAKLSRDGVPRWSLATGGPLTERGLSVALDGAGGVYVVSSFQSPVDFGGGVLTPDPSRIASALVRYAP